MHVSIHGKGVHTLIQEYPISTNHGQQHSSAVNHEISRPGVQGHSKNLHHIYICGGSKHIFPNFDLRIKFFLHGLFSDFLTSNPLLATIEGTYEIYLTKPEVIWNPG